MFKTRFIGYCPQFDALLDNMTARETLKIFCLIRGVPRDECNYTAERLAKDFDFTEHLDKEVAQLSGGNKRKLSTSIALIGDAPIIFLDEPTTGKIFVRFKTLFRFKLNKRSG